MKDKKAILVAGMKKKAINNIEKKLENILLLKREHNDGSK